VEHLLDEVIFSHHRIRVFHRLLLLRDLVILQLFALLLDLRHQHSRLADRPLLLTPLILLSFLLRHDAVG
jgi:hypothetical protein